MHKHQIRLLYLFKQSILLQMVKIMFEYVNKHNKLQ